MGIRRHLGNCRQAATAVRPPPRDGGDRGVLRAAKESHLEILQR